MQEQGRISTDELLTKDKKNTMIRDTSGALQVQGTNSYEPKVA